MPNRLKPTLLLLALAVMATGTVQAAGETPADFKLNNLAGPPVSLSDHLGTDVLLLSFWATWCTPCKAEMPHLQALHEKFSDQGLVILGINNDEAGKQADVRSEVNSRGLKYTILLDSDTEVLSTLNPSKTLPYSVIIGRDGTIHSTHAGFNPGDEVGLEEELKALLAVGGEAAPTEEAVPVEEAAPAEEAVEEQPCAAPEDDKKKKKKKKKSKKSK